MLKITRLEGTDSRSTLKFEGKLLKPWLEEVRRVLSESSTPARALALDLSAVTFVDAEGIQLLRELRGRGVAIAACSAFVAQMMHEGTSG